MAVQHVEAMDRYLSGVARAAPGALATSKASQQRCLLSMLAKKPVSVDDAGTCLELLSQQNYWSIEEQEAFARAISAATEAGPDGRGQATKRGQQDYQHIANYIPEDVWQKLCAAELAESAKIACICELMVSLGFLNPLHEKTAQKVAGLLSFMPGAQPNLTLQHLFDCYKSVRQGLSAACAAAHPQLQSWPHVAQLPADPQHLQECWLQHGLGDRKPTMPANLDLAMVAHLTTQIPMRDTPRLAFKNAFLLDQSAWLRRAAAKQPAWQRALQTQLCVMGQPTPAVQAGTSAQLSGQVSAAFTALSLPAPQTEPGAELQIVSSVASPPVPGSVQALPAPASLQALPAPEIPPALPAPGRLVDEEPALQVPALTLKEAPKQPSTLIAAQALAEDLLQKSAKKRLRGKQSAESRPPGKKKTPTAGDKHEVKKMAGKAQSAGQRAASSAAPNSKEELAFRVSQGVPLKLLKAHAKGCGRCRHRAGCTNSCWKKRGFLLDL